MTEPTGKGLWASGDAYEPYVGRWSRLVAEEFLRWLDVPKGSRWLDVGCGTGALMETILSRAEPDRVRGIDPSPGFLAYAEARISDPRVSFVLGDAQALPEEAGSFDVVISGLMLNFVPEPSLAVSEMMRVACTGGTVALYVWDYANRMEMMRYFWDAAVALDPAAFDLDEARRSPICNPDSLQQLFRGAGLTAVETRPIDVPTTFRDFDDYWLPFLAGGAPAPRYVMSLNDERRAALRDNIRARLPVAPDGSIPLSARAWAVRGAKVWSGARRGDCT